MFALQEQRERVMLQVIDTGSQCRKPDGPNSEDSASGVEGLGLFSSSNRGIRDCAAQRLQLRDLQCAWHASVLCSRNQFEMI